MSHLLLRVPVQQLAVGACTLDPESSRYVVKVHRLQAGDEVLLFDPTQGLEGVGVIQSDRLPQIVVQLDAVAMAPRHQMPVSLIVGVGKSDKPDQAMRDVTALGAQRLVLISADRSVARAESNARADRLRRVSQQVARQCGRSVVPELHGPMSLQAFLDEAPTDQLKLVCAFSEEARPLLSYAPDIQESSSVAVLVGPEGGWSSEELARCVAAGCRVVDLGPYVLRTETAVGACLGALRAYYLAL